MNLALALLLKPLIAMGLAVLYYFVLLVPVRWLQRRSPRHWLWRER